MKHDLLLTLRPLVLTCKYLGVLPLNVDGARVQPSILVHRLSITVHLFTLALQLYEVYYWLHLFLVENSEHRDKPADLNNFFVIFISFVAGITTFTLIFRRVPKIIKILQELNSISQEISTSSFHEQIRNYLKCLFFPFFIFMVVFIAYEPYLWPEDDVNWASMSGFIFMRLMTAMLEQQFLVLCLVTGGLIGCVNERLQIANEALQVTRMRRLHGRLCEVLQMLDDTYDMPLLLWLFVQWFDVTNGLFYFFKSIREIESIQGLFLLVGSTTWTPFTALRSVLLCYTAGNITFQIQRTSIVLRKLINHGSLSNDAAGEVTVFLERLLHQRHRLTVSRILPLDPTLLFTMSGALTTYLIIVMQFQ